jgi:hypothetical protein
VFAFRGSRELLFFGDGDEVSELTQFHHDPFWLIQATGFDDCQRDPM